MIIEQCKGTPTPDVVSSVTIATRAQQEMFLVEKTTPELNCVAYSYRIIEGALDIEYLASSIKVLINHLPLLQTRFSYVNGELWQIHDQRIAHPLQISDLRQYSDPLAEAYRKMRQSREQAKQASIIGDGALYGFILYILEDKKFVLNIWFHHVLIDGRSFALLELLLTKTYNNIAKLDKIESELSQFVFDAIAIADQDYQNSKKRLRDEAFWSDYISELKSYALSWRRQLTGANKQPAKYLSVITQQQRKTIQSTEMARGVSEQVMLFTAAVLLIRTLMGQPRFSVSMPVPGTGKVVGLGMTSNVLPLLVNLPDDMSMQAVIQFVAKEIRTILKHQRYRGEDVQRLSGYREIAGFGPVINVMVFGRGEDFASAHSVSYLGANRDDAELQITFWGGEENDIKVIFDDVTPGYSYPQLAQLNKKLQSIINFLTDHPEKSVAELLVDCQLDGDQVLQDSLYFQRQQPNAAGFLQWQLPAEQLERQIYASGWLGSSVGAFVLPRVRLAEQMILVAQLECRVSTQPDALPGTVLAIDDAGWLIAVKQGAVYLRELRDEIGDAVAAKTLAERCGLQVGTPLPLISASQAQRLSDCRNRLLPQQSVWRDCLTEPVLAQLSSHTEKTVSQPASADQQSQWQKTRHYSLTDLLPSDGMVSDVDLLTAWFIYLARDHSNRDERFQLAWRQHADQTLTGEMAAMLLAPLSPFEIAIDLSRTFAEIALQVRDRCQHWQRLPACLSETVIQQIIAGQRWLAKARPWPLAVVLAEPEDQTSTLEQQAVGQLLTLHIAADRQHFHWVYDQQQITITEVEQITTHLLRLLAEAKQQSNAELPVSLLEFLSPHDYQQLRVWGNSEVKLLTTPPALATLPALFSLQLSQYADATALRYGEHQVSYRELNQRANRLAHRLIAQGVRPEQRVALCAERSIELIVAMLAILKAGGVYVPLDPSYPAERLRYILQDAEPLLLLADQLGSAVLGQHNITTLALEAALFEHGSTDDPVLPTLMPNCLAYLSYTSGSTGQPKGVMVEHQQIVNLVMATGDALLKLGVEVARTVLNFSVMFDFCWDELALLFHGGQLSLTASDDKYDPEKIVHHLIRENANYFCCTPSQLEGVLSAGLVTQLTGKLLLFVGGEALSAELWRRLQQTEKLCAVNTYGPTETTVDATFVVIEAGGLSEPVIGRPIANTCIYLLDSEQQLVAPGAVGEIYIGGTGVARGYFKRPDLTEQRFLPDPFSLEPQARIYRSGDLGRWRADGQLAYLGRNDEQVKIRGFRIELGEIAAQLSQHPSVNEAVVVARGEANALQLVAYLIANAKQRIDAMTLRQYLAARLPDYMLPVAYVPITELPLTPNGKLDKRALPEPNQQAFARAEYVAPEGEIEQGLAAIWRELLAVEQVSRDDNFFALGGHSLLVIKMCDLITKRLAKTALVATVFSARSLAVLAASLQGKQLEQEDAEPQMTRDKQLPAMSFISAPQVVFEHILLTGAAGFLGIYLLAELQQQHPRAIVYCVVRGDNGLQRLRQTAQRYQLTLDEQRLEVIKGDLSTARLALSQQSWQRLAQQIDVIYHCGAWVNHLHSYSTLRDSNVQSTSELLALCCQGRAKQLFYISTLSTAAQQGNRLCEAEIAESLPTANGYVQSKWVCEHLMMQAFAGGLHGAIYRMGNITGSTQHGASNVENNHTLSVIKGCLQIGVAPDWRDNRLDISPVDRLATLVVAASSAGHYLNRALNLGYLATVSWRHLFQYLISKGHSVRLVAPEIWSSDWVAQIGSDNALYPFKAFYLSAQQAVPESALDVVEKVLVDATAAPLEIKPLLESYYHYWRQSGFLSAPEGEQHSSCYQLLEQVG
ncbi:non-ribosomal peptide synthetase [Serratia microhaemolytica]|uniref:non-ribosomal peptide synthetase n=1 Tax=Serratia microhaemolytica TaxID=2675110 RepID=UPI000FDEC9B3|nr:non-ribosomal peptide synthetase [Serratia microhaemolytica]